MLILRDGTASLAERGDDLCNEVGCSNEVTNREAERHCCNTSIAEPVMLVAFMLEKRDN